MVELKLAVFLLLTTADKAALFKECPLPDEVECIFSPLSDVSKFRLPRNMATLVLTDKKDALPVLCRQKAAHLHIVFLGEGSSADVDVSEVEELWENISDDTLLQARFRRTLERLKDKYDAFSYRELLLKTINTSQDMYWIKRKDGIHILVNDAFSDIVSKPKEDCMGRDHCYIWNVTPEQLAMDGAGCEESDNQVIAANGKVMIFEEPVQTKGTMKQFNTYKCAYHDPFGQVLGTLGFGHDVTNLSNLGLELSMIIDNLPYPILLCSAEWTTIRMNSHFRALVETSGAAAEDDFNFIAWKDIYLRPISAGDVNEGAHTVTQEFEANFNGQIFSFILMEQEVRDYFDNVTGYYCLFRDITFQRIYEQKILTAANTDELTGLHNRRYFYDFIKEKQGSPLTLLYMDLDHFKEVNDGYGHARGDDVLKKTAEYITAIFPEGTAARLGGDEYALLLEGETNVGDLKPRCEELEQRIRSIFREGDLYVTVSIGIAQTDGSLDSDAFIREADGKMYEIKKRHHEETGSG